MRPVALNRNTPAWLILTMLLAGHASAANFTVTSPDDSGLGTLRQAITDANAAAGADLIEFDAAVTTIALASSLPNISETLVIDGSVNATLVALDGATNAVAGTCLIIDSTAANCELYGLEIHGFGTDGVNAAGSGLILGAPGKGNVIRATGGDVLELTVSSSAALVQSNLFGLLPDGTTLSASVGGIQVRGSNHTFGGDTPAERNVVAGPSGSNAFNIIGGTGHKVMGNYIGTDVTGTADFGASAHGVYCQANNFQVGGPNPGEGNLIAGNTLNGVHLSALSSFLVEGNTIGLSSSGTSALPNTHGIFVLSTNTGGTIRGNTISGNSGDGINCAGDNIEIHGNVIGLGTDGSTNVGNSGRGIYLFGGSDSATITGNVVSSNAGYGIRMENCFEAIIQGNKFGTDSAGNPGHGNTDHGISIVNTGATTPVAATVGGLGVGEGNLVFSNSGYGIEINANQANTVLGNHIGSNTNNGIRLVGTGGVTVQGNIVGLDIGGTVAAPNATGISAGGTGLHVIGGATVAERNIVSGNTGAGISVSAPGTTVEGNYAGTNAAGTSAIPNTTSGITISGVNVTVRGNLASGNGGGGLFINGATATVENNFVGTNAAGTGALPNSGIGLRCSTDSDGSSVTGNLASGNNGSGIYSDPGASALVIRGNIVGLNATMTAVIPNTGGNPKVWINGPNTTIGGPNPADANVIAGNVGVGVLPNGTGAVIQGNYIGTNPSFASGLGNTSHGVQYNNTAFGGQVLDNVICSNGGQGVRLNIGDAIVQGNFIGTNPAETLALGNGSDGVGLNTGPGSTVGGIGAGEGNVIANNGGNGVSVGSGITGSPVTGNSIYSNALLGISHGPATLRDNDALDADAGANGQQNHPEIGPVETNDTAISGTFSGAASTDIAIHAYSNTECDPSGSGEGRTYLGTATVTTDPSGFAPWTLTVGSPLASGTILTATATDVAASATSMFSPCVLVEDNPAPTILSIERAPAATNPIVEGDTAEFVLTFTEPVIGVDLSDLTARETGGLSGSTLTTVTLTLGNHATFDGVADMFEVPSGTAPNLAGNSYSWEFWVNRASAGTTSYVFTLGTTQSANNYLHVGFSNTNFFRFNMWSDDLAAPFADSRTNHWTHFAGTYDATTNAQLLYMDGVQIASRTAGSDFLGTGPLRISNIDDNPFHGSIDELRLWSTVRTPAEIANNMHGRLTGGETGLVAYFTFDAFEDLGVNSDGADDLRDYSPAAAHADGTGAPSLAASGVRAATATVTALSGAGSGLLGLDVLADGTVTNANGFAMDTPVSGSGEEFTVTATSAVADWQLLDH